MFNKADLIDSNSAQLSLDRQIIGFSAVLCFLNILLFMKTICGAKLPFVLTISGMSAVTFALAIVSALLFNWAVFGVVEKDISSDAQDSLFTAAKVTAAIGMTLYYQTYWMFTYRYKKVASLVASLKSGKMSSSYEWTNYAMHLAIIANGTTLTIINSEDHTHMCEIFWLWIPCAFVLADCLVLFMSLLQIWYTFRNDTSVMINERFMIFHLALLIVMALS